MRGTLAHAPVTSHGVTSSASSRARAAAWFGARRSVSRRSATAPLRISQLEPRATAVVVRHGVAGPGVDGAAEVVDRGRVLLAARDGRARAARTPWSRTPARARVPGRSPRSRVPAPEGEVGAAAMGVGIGALRVEAHGVVEPRDRLLGTAEHSLGDAEPLVQLLAFVAQRERGLEIGMRRLGSIPCRCAGIRAGRRAARNAGRPRSPGSTAPRCPATSRSGGASGHPARPRTRRSRRSRRGMPGASASPRRRARRRA